jgi:hypothetical protein
MGFRQVAVHKRRVEGCSHRAERGWRGVSRCLYQLRAAGGGARSYTTLPWNSVISQTMVLS